MQHVVDWNKIDELGSELILYADNELTNQVNVIMDLKNSVVWEGAAADEVLKEFMTMISKIQKMILATKKYGLFLKGVADKYKQANNNIRNAFDMDVMSGAKFY